MCSVQCLCKTNLIYNLLYQNDNVRMDYFDCDSSFFITSNMVSIRM